MSYSPPHGYPAHHQYHQSHQRSPSSKSVHEHPLHQHPNGHGADQYHHQYHDQQQQQPTTPMSAGTSSPGDPDCGHPPPYPATHHYHHHSSGVRSSESISRLVSSSERSPFRSPATASATPVTKRPKSHVASACVNCKKAHLACDVSRPCARCVGLGKQDTCHDVQHKKRGRPRLRDERSHSFEVAHSSPISSPTTLSSNPHYRSSHRVLKSHPSLDHNRLRRHSLTPREDVASYATGYFDYQEARGSRISLPPITNSTAYLTSNLVIVKSTERLRELLGYSAAELDGRQSLFDIVLTSDRDKVYQLSGKIQADIQQRGPRQEDLPRTTLYPAIQAIRESDLPSATHGSTTHSEIFHLRRPDGSHLRIRIQATLGFCHVYFVVVDFSLAHEMPPPLQLQNGASQLPTPSSLPHSAGSSVAPLSSPSFLTAGSQRPLQPEHPGPQSPYNHQPHVHGMERPRTVHPESHYHPPPPPPQSTQPQYAPYPSPTHPPSNYYNPPPPSSAYSSKNGFISPGFQPSDLQLPPLQLPSYPELRRRNSGHYEVPRRERIGVREMLD